MERVDVSKVRKIWNDDGKNLKHPSVFFAVYRDKIYYVFRDDSFIIFMIPKNCNVTYALPKKYCKIKKDKNGEKYYKISDIENASLVSCIGTKNDYEKLIINKIIVNPTC